MIPEIGSKWEHKSGRLYIVNGFSNVYSTDERYPPTIIYECEALGTVWSRPIADWRRSMALSNNKGEG